MPDVLEMPTETRLESCETVPAATPVVPTVTRGEAGKWLPGYCPNPQGRPKGVKNAEKSLLRAAPKLAKAYIKEGIKGNATILTDARKWIMPTDGESAGIEGSAIIAITFGAPVIPSAASLPASSPPSLPLPVTPSLSASSKKAE